MCAGLQVLVVKTMGCNNRGLLAAMVGWPVVMLVFEEKCRDRWLGIISFDRRTPPGLFIYIYRGAPPIVIYLFFRAITTLSAMACLFIIIGCTPPGVLFMFVFVSGMWSHASLVTCKSFFCVIRFIYLLRALLLLFPISPSLNPYSYNDHFSNCSSPSRSSFLRPAVDSQSTRLYGNSS